MTFAVNMTNGIVHHQLHQDRMTAECFNQFLEDASLRCNPRQEVCFIFDNVRAHVRAALADLLHGLQIQYLPHILPFSIYYVRMLLPCGKQALKTCLAEVRHDLLKQPFNERMAALAQLAEQETLVSPDRMAEAFRGMQAYMPRYFDKGDIFM